MHKHLPSIVAACIAAVLVATFAVAGPGLGISKTEPISGTGSSGNPLKLTVCDSGSGYVSNGTSFACALAGDITGVTAGSGMTGTATSGAASLDVIATTGGGLTSAADSIGMRTDCTSTYVLAWDGDSWECTAAGGSYTAGDGITLTASDFDVGAGTNIDVDTTSVSVEPTVSLAGATDEDTLDVANSATGQTTTNSGIDLDMTGTYNATGAAKISYGINITNSSARSAGANNLSNYGVSTVVSGGTDSSVGYYANTNGTSANYSFFALSSGGSSNYSFYGQSGQMLNADDVTFSDVLTINGETGVDTLNVNNSDTGQAAGIKGVDTNLTGTTTGTYSNYAGYFSNTMASTDSETYTLTNYGLYSTASGADGTNYSGYFDAGEFRVMGAASFRGADISSSAAGVSSFSSSADTAGRTMVDATSSGVLTVGGATSAIGYQASITNTRSGAGSLTNYGAYLDASGADTNYALWTQAGSVNFEGATVVDDTLNVTGNSTFDGNVTLGNESGDAITVTGTTTFDGSVGRIKGVTEAINTAGGTQSNLAVAATTSIVKYTTTAGAATTLTGIAITGGQEDGDILFFTIGANITVTFSVETTSTAANRFSSQSDASDWSFRGPTTITLIYDGTLSRWAIAPITNRLPTLTVTGTVTTTSTNTFGDGDGDVTLVRMAKDNSTAPTLSTCGTSPSVTGGSWAFTITLGTGTPTACTATFASTKTATPTCVATIQDVAEDVYVSAVSATAVTITAKTGTTDLSSNKVDVICIGDG